MTDDGSPSLSDTVSFDVTVNEVDTSPVLNAVGAQSGDEETMIGFTATAFDPDVPESLVFSLEDGAGSVPAGASITGGGVFSWTPTEAQGPGVFSFDVVVTDSTLRVDRETISVTVAETNIAPVAGAIADRFPNEGSMVSLVATASDADLPANGLSWSQDSGPGSVDAGGNYSWTPTEADGPGTYTVVLRVTDDGSPNLSDTVSFDVTVTELNQPPTADPIGDLVVDEGVVVSLAASYTDADVPANGVVWILKSGPGSVDGAGDYSWSTSEADGPGVYTVVLRVTDDGSPNLSDTVSFNVTVNELNQAPVADPIADLVVDEGDVASVAATYADGDVPVNGVVWSLDSGPGVVGGAGNYSWVTSDADGPGTYTVVLRVTDDGSPNLSDTVSFNVTVNEPNQPPAANPIGDQTVDEGDEVNVTATALDSGGGLTWSLDSGPGTVDAVGNYSWATTEADGPGTYTVVLRVSDDGTPNLFDTASFAIIVNEVNQAPIVVDPGPQSVEEGVELNVILEATDADHPENQLTWSAVDLPPGLIIDAATGVVSGVVDLGGLEATFDSVITVVDDGSPVASSSLDLSWNVTGNLPPVAADDFYQTNRGGTLSVPAPGLLANDADLDGDALNASVRLRPLVGTLDLAPDGSFVYTHNGGTVKEDVFVYEISDGRGGSSTGTVLISIVNRPPVTSPDLLAISEDDSGVVAPLLNDSDPDGDPLVLVDVSEPDVGSIATLPDGAVRYTPPPDYHGEFIIRYSVSDENGGTATEIITIRVIAVNDEPTASDDFVTADAYLPATVTILTNDRDVDGDELTISRIEGEPVGTVTINSDNTLTYVPRPGWVGLDTFRYVVVDSSGAASSATVTISIPAALLAAANELTERLGTASLPFEAPKSDSIDTPELVGFTSGITLISKAFFQSLGALGLPLAFLGFGVGVVVVLGAFTEVPLLLLRRNRRFYSVVRLDRGRRLSVVTDPEQPGLPIYLYEATAAGIRSLDRPRMFGDQSWTPVESPAGDGWVESEYLTETVDLEYFLQDAQAVTVASSFVEALRSGGDFARYFTDSGLSIALTNHPVFVSAEEVSEAIELMSQPDGQQNSASPGQVVFIEALAQLREAVAATPNVDARISHSKRSLIPVEVLNYQYLVLDSQGENSWLLHLAYRRGKPFIAGFGLDV